jgi:hypothetical protein
VGHIVIKESVGGRRYITPMANNGSIKTGLVAGDFTVVLAASSGNPPTTTTITPVHIASGSMQDSWIVDIPSAFLVTNGVGDYYLRIVIGATGPKYDALIGEPILVTQNLLDDISAGGGASIADIQDVVIPAIEYQRGHHTAETYIYVDPSAGNDSNNGLTRGAPKLTLSGGSGAIAAITQEHTAIVVLGNAAGQQVINENITLATPYTFLRGPGFDIQLAGLATGTPTVSITAVGCEVSGFEVTTPGTGTQDAILATANFSLLRRLRVFNARQDGISISGGSRLRIEECIVENNSRYGVHVLNTSFAFIGKNTVITGSGSDNLRIQPGIGSADDTVINGVTTTSAGGYGIFIGAGSNRTRITGTAFVGNTSGKLQDDGTDTFFDTVELVRKILTNRLELADGGTTGNWILYDDDDSVLLTFDVSDKGGLAISLPDGTPARRTKAV